MGSRYRVSRPVHAEGYTVREVADLAGVSVRTMHHYDAVGLLKPAGVRPNGYRFYGREELLRLQEIRVLRELDMSLKEIAATLQVCGDDRADRLSVYRERLAADLARKRQLIATLDATISSLKGNGTMSDDHLYQGFAPEKQADYEVWLIERYGDTMQADIERARGNLEKRPDGTFAPRAEAMERLRSLEGELVGAFEKGLEVGSDDLDALLEQHRAWVGEQWGYACSREAYAGLADLYLSHPDFVARYEALAPGFSAYLTDAMKAYSAEGSDGRSAS